jgi:hypothetical protein
MENPSSPLDTLRQLKEMLDAGALTPTEFEALKQRLVFMPGAPGPVAEPPAAPASILPTVPIVPEAAPLPVEYPDDPASFSGANGAIPPPFRPMNDEAVVFEPVPEPAYLAEAGAGFPPTEGGPSSAEAELLADDDALDFAHPPAARNSSLGLILAIGAVLVFLAVVAYLGFTRPTTNEHLSSTSQTAADSANTTIETGPQVAPLPATAIEPETVRIAPANPAPPLPTRAEMDRKAAALRDSVAPVVAPAATDSTGRH